MAFGFKRIKKNSEYVDFTPKVETVINKEGNIELKSKNFTITASSKPDTESSSVNISWQCWGCGNINTEPVCPVCGKKRAK